MISTRLVGLVIDTVVCLTLAKWETVSGQFGGYLSARQRNANSSLRQSVLASFSAVKRRLVVYCFARYFWASVPIPKFASPCGTILCELRNQRDTSKLMTLVWFLDLKFLCERAVCS